MEAESKTPAASLTGVELCERVALGMGWTQKYGYGMSVFVDASGFDRGIPPRNFERVGIARDRFFRPDLDGNHLAEVKAECDLRDWPWMEAKSRQGMAHGMVNGYRVNAWNAWDELPSSTAFLRAFVAASEAEKEKIQ